MPRVRCLALEAHFAIRLVAFAGDFVGLAGDVESTHGHLADGERASLVSANDGRGAKRLDRRQFTDERATPRHSQHAECEGYCDNSGQSFRDSGDREAHRRHKQLEELHPANQPQHEQQRYDAK